jgi:hypothetical protein
LLATAAVLLDMGMQLVLLRHWDLLLLQQLLQLVGWHLQYNVQHTHVR